MLAIFTGWSLFGFSYPFAPGPIVLNDLSKVLALLAALTMFLPRSVRAEVAQVARSRDSEECSSQPAR
jgi:hypothetical protein